jgi:peptidoglycan/xylan/chitin deacetylase (PgdA/CDA1 family)
LIRPATLSLDLDNLWSYQKTHGDPGWSGYASYLDVVVPHVLDLLERRALRITVFVVGQDAALERNHAALAAIAAAGHEIGNHSFRHEPWLHRYSEDELRAEITQAEDAIESATGSRPVGFRGPGYSLSEPTLQVLAERGYHYDASTLPTVIGPLARSYYFRSARLSAAERAERALLFGSFRDGLRPIRPYQWQVGERLLPEIPVTTMPFLRIPIHVNYLLYLSGLSPLLAHAYFRAALRLCRLTGVAPSILLHPLDFLGVDDVEGLSFFPGMGLTGRKKRDLVRAFVDDLGAGHEVHTLDDYAALVGRRGSPALARVTPAFGR